MPIESFLIRMSSGDELSVGELRLMSILVVDRRRIYGTCEKSIVIQAQSTRQDLVLTIVDFCAGKSIEECITAAPDIDARPLVRLACAICLIDKDCGVLEPDILVEDAGKYGSATPEEREKIEQRAIKRGKVGWNVGRAISEAGNVQPHYRRPHFGIRWKGPGGKQPSLVPISGSVVKRVTAQPVPTGYLDAPLCSACKLLPVKFDAEGEMCDACANSLSEMAGAA
jgi:hypothetical protein